MDGIVDTRAATSRLPQNVVERLGLRRPGTAFAARKFDAATGERLAAALEGVADADRLAQVGDWIIECETAAELFARFQDD